MNTYQATPNFYNFYDYIHAWENSLLYENNQQKHSWWIKFNLTEIDQPIPQWFLSFFFSWGAAPSIFPRNIKDIWRKLLRSLSTKKSLKKDSKNKEIILFENFEREMNDWKLPDISKSKVYKKGSFELKSDYVVITQEKSIPLKEGFETYKLLENSLISQHKEKYLFLHLGMIQVGIKPMTREGLNIYALITVRDKRHLRFEDSLLGIIESSLAEGPIYFGCCPNLSRPLIPRDGETEA